MFAEERRQKILEMLQREQRIFARDVAEMFGISIDSVRRDLTAMEEEGLLKKTHGGAIPAMPVRSLPPHPSIRYNEGSDYYNAIARKAAEFIQEGNTVFIGGAGIHYNMIRFLPSFRFTVVTNSIKIADSIKEMQHIETYLIGGKVKASGNITDSMASDMLRLFSLDLSFLTGGGISKKGISTATPEVAAGIRTVSEISRRNICLAPYNKLGADAFAKAVPIKSMDVVITDEEASEDAVDDIRNVGVEVVIAK